MEIASDLRNSTGKIDELIPDGSTIAEHVAIDFGHNLGGGIMQTGGNSRVDGITKFTLYLMFSM